MGIWTRSLPVYVLPLFTYEKEIFDFNNADDHPGFYATSVCLIYKLNRIFFITFFSLPKCWTNNSQRVLFNFENYYVVVRYFWSTTTRRLPVYLILETKNRLYEKHCKSLIYRVLQKLSFIFPNTFLMEKWLFDKFLEMLICYRTQKCPLTQTDFMTNIL